LYVQDQQSEQLQLMTENDSRADQKRKTAARDALKVKGHIADSGFFGGSPLLRGGGPLAEYVRWLDSEADLDDNSTKFSVQLRRVAGPSGPSYRLKLVSAGPTAGYVLVKEVQAGCTQEDAARHRLVLAAHALHTPLRPAPAPAPAAPVVNGFALLMAGGRGGGGGGAPIGMGRGAAPSSAASAAATASASPFAPASAWVLQVCCCKHSFAFRTNSFSFSFIAAW
jgi:hypothetical protein